VLHCSAALLQDGATSSDKGSCFNRMIVHKCILYKIARRNVIFSFYINILPFAIFIPQSLNGLRITRNCTPTLDVIELILICCYYYYLHTHYMEIRHSALLAQRQSNHHAPPRIQCPWLIHCS